MYCILYENFELFLFFLFSLISFEEFRKLLPFLNVNISDAKAYRYFRMCDTDGSGEIDVDEFKVALFTCDPTSGNPVGFQPASFVTPMGEEGCMYVYVCVCMCMYVYIFYLYLFRICDVNLLLVCNALIHIYIYGSAYGFKVRVK